MGYDEERVILLLSCDQGDWDPGAFADPVSKDSPLFWPMIAVRDSN